MANLGLLLALKQEQKKDDSYWGIHAPSYVRQDSKNHNSWSINRDRKGVQTMNAKSFRYALPVCLLVAILSLPATVGLTQQGQTGPTGDLSVVGEVSVNGTSALSGATVFSDSTITTARGSSAVVSLGKLGRLDVFPETTVILRFTRSSIAVEMVGDGGRIRLVARVDASVATDDGLITTTPDKKTDFIVDTGCGNTFVAVKKGELELRGAERVVELSTREQDTIGPDNPGCTPSDSDDDEDR